MIRMGILMLVVGGLAWGQPSGQPSVTVEPLSGASAFHAGETALLGLRVRLSEGWHMNAHKPLEDYLIPTELTVEGPEGVRVEKIAYPEAEVRRFAFSDEP